MRGDNHTVTTVPLPLPSDVRNIYQTTHLADAYSIPLPDGTTTDPEMLARFIFSDPSRWVTALMAIRDAAVALFGLKTAGKLTADRHNKSDCVGIFKVYSISRQEIIMGDDDNHLDFRLSLLHQMGTQAASESRLIVSTVVHCHNRLGRVYIFIIAPFHRVIIKSMLCRAARSWWPQAITR